MRIDKYKHWTREAVDHNSTLLELIHINVATPQRT